MKNILVIKSAITGGNSVSNKYVGELLSKIKDKDDEVTVRDLAKNDVGTLNNEHLLGLSDETSAVSKKFNSIIDEIKNNDIIIIGAPMYNFTISGVLKNYLDAITLVNKTFRYSESGTPEGLLKNKKVYVVSSRGGFHKDSDRTFQEDYLRCHLGFLGLTDVTFLFIEGTAMGITKEDMDKQFLDQLV